MLLMDEKTWLRCRKAWSLESNLIFQQRIPTCTTEAGVAGLRHDEYKQARHSMCVKDIHLNI
jgi:hypothetical protein